MRAVPPLPDLVFVLVNSRNDLRAKALFYREAGYKLQRARRFAKITIDLQDVDTDGKVRNLDGYAAFIGVRMPHD